MRVTRRQLRRIIQEQGIGHETAGTGIDRGNRFTPDVIVQYLSDNAATYHQDRALDPESIAMLLRDDFMDNIGAQVALSPEYEDLIVNLAQNPRHTTEGKKMRITKRQLKRIIREERQRILRELHDPLDPHAGGRGPIPSVQDIFDEAGLTPQEVSETLSAVEEGGFDWMETPSYEKLLFHFMGTGEMPYGVAKARTGDPDIWILDHLEGLGA